MYLLGPEPDPELKGAVSSIPEGLWRPSDEAYLSAGRQPPSNWEMHMVARIRLKADRQLKRSTPQWIRDWALHPSFGTWK